MARGPLVPRRQAQLCARVPATSQHFDGNKRDSGQHSARVRSVDESKLDRGMQAQLSARGLHDALQPSQGRVYEGWAGETARDGTVRAQYAASFRVLAEDRGGVICAPVFSCMRALGSAG